MSPDSLEAKVAVLEKQLARLQAVDEIRKLMGRHTVNHNAKNMAKTLSFFALDEPNVSVEVGDRGVYVGRAAIETLFKDQYGSASVKGNLLFPFLTTEMIEVAQDGMSAKGTWRSPSVQVYMPTDDQGEPEPIWLFGSYAVDFLRTTEGWKILHFHWYRTIKASHYKGWCRDLSWAFGGKLADSPDLLPTTYHNPWTKDSIQDSIPGCPPPFDTYDGPEWQNRDQSEAWNLHTVCRRTL